MATKPTKKTTTKKPVKKPPKKAVKQHTLAEKTQAVFRCKCGESHKAVADAYGITSITMDRWVTRWKPVPPEVVLEMLNSNMARILQQDTLGTRELSAAVSGIKMILEKGSTEGNENRLEELQEAGAKQLVILKGLAEKAGVEIDT